MRQAIAQAKAAAAAGEAPIGCIIVHEPTGKSSPPPATAAKSITTPPPMPKSSPFAKPAKP